MWIRLKFAMCLKNYLFFCWRGHAIPHYFRGVSKQTFKRLCHLYLPSFSFIEPNSNQILRNESDTWRDQKLKLFTSETVKSQLFIDTSCCCFVHWCRWTKSTISRKNAVFSLIQSSTSVELSVLHRAELEPDSQKWERHLERSKALLTMWNILDYKKRWEVRFCF